MVKERISATIEPDTAKLIDKIMKKGKYRNKAHLVEDAIRQLALREGK